MTNMVLTQFWECHYDVFYLAVLLQNVDLFPKGFCYIVNFKFLPLHYSNFLCTILAKHVFWDLLTTNVGSDL